MGPIIGSKGRTIYVTTLIDEYTCYTELLITDDKAFKAEFLEKLQVWNSRFPGEKIRFFRSDNAVEMPNSQELAKLSIEKEPIASYSPEQNGVAEAMKKVLIRQVKKIVGTFKNATLMDETIKDANYFSLLRFIFLHAAYLHNHLKPRNREDVPKQVYQNVKVDPLDFLEFHWVNFHSVLGKAF